MFAFLSENDFQIFWNIGRAFLDGLDPYLSVSGSWYPPATTALFAIFCLFSVQVSYLIWLFINAMILVGIGKRKALLLLFYYPISHLFVHGQLDLALFALVPLLRKRNWQSVVAVAAISLKPQVAMIVLPWFLTRWLIEDRKLLAKSVSVTAGLHLVPLALRPSIYSEWFTVFSRAVDHKMGGTGIWRFFNIPLPILLLITFLIILFAAVQNSEKLCRTILFVTNPFIAAYDAVVLMDVAPVWLLIPVSWLTLGLAHAFESFSVFPIIPFACLLWLLGNRYRSQRLRAIAAPAQRVI